MKVVEKDKVISGMLRDELKRCREMLESLENRWQFDNGNDSLLVFFCHKSHRNVQDKVFLYMPGIYCG